jgi:hypothetical protein
VLINVAGKGPVIDPVKLGLWLKAHLDRRISVDDGVLRLTKDKKESRTATSQWRMIGEGTPKQAAGPATAGDDEIPF